MELDRKLQRDILEDLRGYYDQGVSAVFPEDDPLRQRPFFDGNLRYLHEHGLVHVEYIAVMGDLNRMNHATITMNGLDFLEDDGGLSAIFRERIIKFDAENLRNMLSDAVIKSSLTKPERDSFLKKIQELPAEGLKRFVLKVFDQGINLIPNLMEFFSHN